MTIIRFIYKNQWREGTILTQSTEQAQFPADNTQDDCKSLVWQSRNGTGSGNGRFIVDATNHHIDFDEGGAELNATLTNGTYTGQTLAAEIKIQMDAAGGTYTITYSEATGKFTIAEADNFTLLWHAGTNQATCAATLLGFVKANHYTGDKTYTSDNAVIHTSESIDNDNGSAEEYDFVALLNHNLTSAAVITVQGADDSAFTTNVVSDTLTFNGNNIFEFLAASRTKHYRRLTIIDPKNPSMYIKIGVIVIGKYAAPNRGFGPYESGSADYSEMEHSPASAVFAVQIRPKLDTKILPFKGLNSTTNTMVTLMNNHNGVDKAMIICLDSTAPNTNSYWMRFSEFSIPACDQEGYWNWTATLEEVL